MTQQEFTDACESMVEKIDALKNENTNIIADGVINPYSYYDANPKILWVLKEANSTEKTDWNYQDFFKYTWHKHSNIMAVRRIVFTTYGLFNMINHLEELPLWSDSNYQKEVKKMAIINIKKTPGSENVDDSVISAAYAENRELIKEQIELYNPNVVIFGGTFRFFPWEDIPGATRETKQTLNNSAYYPTADRLYISTSHPSYRKLQDKEYIMGIVKIYKKWKEELTQNSVTQ